MRPSSLRASVVALVIALVTAACASAPPTPTAPASSAVTPSPSTSADPFAARLKPVEFAPDVVLAAQQALAREGVGTYDLASGSATGPTQLLDEPVSPLQLTNDQTRAIALDAWSGAGVTGAALDGLVNTPAGMAPPSLLLAAYVDLGLTPDATPGAALAAGLVGHIDGADAAATSYPLLVLSLFVADVTRSSQPSGQPSISPAVFIAGGICSAVANFVDQALGAVFNAVRSSSSGFLGSLWNIVVSIGQSVVVGLIKALTAPVVETITKIVGVVAIVVNVVSILRPWTVRMTPDDAATRFSVGGQAAIEDGIHLAVDLGGLDSWPPVLEDCALAAHVTLPDLKPFGAPVMWTSPAQFPDPAFPVMPLVTLAGASSLNDTLASDGTTILRLDTGHEDTDTGDAHTGTVKESATVHRPGLDTLKQSVTGLIVNGLPDLVRGVVSSIISGPIDTVIAKIDAITDESANTRFTVTYHEPPSPPPSSQASLTPSPCGTAGGSISPGSYSGSVSWSIHHESGVGSTSTTLDISGTGPMNITVAPGGSVSGTWSLAESGGSVTTSAGGTTTVQGSGGVTNGTVGGTAMQLSLTGTVNWTQTLSVNGVSGPPVSETYAWEYPLLLTPLAGDCSGHVSAVWRPIAYAELDIQLQRTGP